MKIYTRARSKNKNVEKKYLPVDTIPFDSLLFPDGLLTNTLQTAANSSQTCPLHDSQVSNFIRTLGWIAEGPNTTDIQILLAKKNSEVTVQDVVCGFKQLEHIIYAHTNTKRKDTISSNFRWFIGKFGGEILDGRTVSECGFKSRLKEGVELHENISATSINDAIPYIFKTKRTIKNKSEIVYITIDPERSKKIIATDSLIETCLKNSSKDSHKKPINYTVISCIMTILERITNSNNTSNICNLLSKPLKEISTTDILKGLEQLEDFVQGPENNTQSASTLRTFLNKWGGTLSNGKTIRKSGFKSRFTNQGRDLACIKPVTLTVFQKNNGSTTIIKYYFNTYKYVSLTPPRGLLSEIFRYAEKASKNDPIDLTIIKKLEQVLQSISKEYIWKVYKLLTSEPSLITSGDLKSGFIALENMIAKNFTIQEQFHLSKNLRTFITIYSREMICSSAFSQCRFKTRFSFNQKAIRPLIFNIKTKRNGVLKCSQFLLNLYEVEGIYSSDGLLGVALNNAAYASLSEPCFHSSIGSFWQVAKEIEKHINIELRTLLITPPNKVTKKELVNGFKILEDIVDKNKKWSDKYSFSNYFRSFLGKWVGKLSNNLTISQCRFKSRFRKIVPEKTLIEPLDIKGGIKTPPKLTHHQSSQKLRQIIYDYYNDAIQQILHACSEEMDRFQKLHTEVTPLINKKSGSDNKYCFDYEVPREIKCYVEEFKHKNNKATFDKTVDLAKKHDNNLVLAAVLQLRLNTPVNSYFRFPGLGYFIPEYVQDWFPTSGVNRNFAWSGTLLPPQILLVCFVRLVIFTTWNKDVIATLRPEDIPSKLPDHAFEIQGYKDKVDKPTTKVTIYPHNHEMRETIDLLIQHTANMHELGLKPLSIWETPYSTNLSFLRKSNILSLCKRSSQPTPIFTLEQLAKHQINLRYKIDGNLEKSRHERNHSRTQTTTGYMSTPLAKIEYEANNAEFQRRLESTVQFLHSGEQSLSPYDMDPRDIDKNLLSKPEPNENESTIQLPLFLLGDGSSCTNIWASVDRHHHEQSICRGRKCHSDGGCIYNKVILSPYEFSFTLRKLQWFISRGELLLDKHGRDYFDTYIAPEMIFTLGLTRYVKKVNPLLYQDATALLS